MYELRIVCYLFNLTRYACTNLKYFSWDNTPLNLSVPLVIWPHTSPAQVSTSLSSHIPEATLTLTFLCHSSPASFLCCLSFLALLITFLAKHLLSCHESRSAQNTSALGVTHRTPVTVNTWTRHTLAGPRRSEGVSM